MTNTTTATVEFDELLAAARELSLAGRWDRALRLLDATTAAGPASARGRLARAAAEVALESDWFRRTDLATDRLAAAGKVSDDADWDLGFTRLKHDYYGLLRGDGRVRFGPGGRDPEALRSLRDRAHALRDRAPDQARGGWAEMYTGLITDNLFAERTTARTHYEAALRAGESAGDDPLVREALRHLGDQDHDGGDHQAALDRWRRATEVGARAGAVPGTLAQQMLLAVLTRDAGDEAGARARAEEVARWAGALGAEHIRAQATGFLAGVDPTAPARESGSRSS
ncbi:hypothetical protein ABZT17_27090 [Streptomyces sp. NPDC005648]|uniref:hypothetical protein n=1 Tax=Streptomyces sp. NPDC005648 TaxID=3157044 RepID=UPI0033ACCE0F